VRFPLDLVSLRCFAEAARLNNFRAAAAACALSPTAFGDRIRRLEEQLETALFERTTRSVRLTAAGQRLLVQARAALQKAEDCYQAVTERSPAFSLTLGTRYELGMSWLVPLLSQLTCSNPERTLHLRFGDSSDLLSATRRGEIDAVITSARFAATGLELAALHDEHYCFVASPTLLKQRPLREAAQAVDHTLFDINAELPLFSYLLDATPGRQAWDFAAITTLGTIAAIRHRVLEGAGVAVLPLYFVKADLAARRLVRLFKKTPLRNDCFRLVWKRGHEHTSELRKLAAELAAEPLR
jgi:LysR family transcriptional regulator, glycine cleavage system transcriptional activator